MKDNFLISFMKEMLQGFNDDRLSTIISNSEEPITPKPKTKKKKPKRDQDGFGDIEVFVVDGFFDEEDDFEPNEDIIDLLPIEEEDEEC